MFKIGYDKKITMVQGDTGVIRMRISNYELSQGDEVRFAIVNKANPSILLCQHSDKKIVLEKQVTVFEKDGSARIVIYPYDTEYLQPGKYLYEIQVKTKDGRIDTVVPLTGFTLMDGSIQGEFGQTTPSKPEPTPSEIELRFKRLENEIIPELGNRISNVENEIDSVSSSLDNMGSNLNDRGINALYPPIGLEPISATGEKDDSEKLQKLIDYCQGKGYTLILPPKKILLENTVRLGLGVHIKGTKGTSWSGEKGTVIISNFATVKEVFNIAGNCVTIEDIKIKGNENVIGIKTSDNTYDLEFNNIKMNTVKIGFDIGYSWTYVFNKCRVEAAEIGYNVLNGTSGNFISCVAFHCTEHGFYVKGTQYCTFSGCGSDGCEKAIEIVGPSRGLTFSSWGMENCKSKGIIATNFDACATFTGVNIGKHQNEPVDLIVCDGGQLTFTDMRYTSAMAVAPTNKFLTLNSGYVTLINCYLSGETLGDIDKCTVLGGSLDNNFNKKLTVPQVTTDKITSLEGKSQSLANETTEYIFTAEKNSSYICSAVVQGNGLQYCYQIVSTCNVVGSNSVVIDMGTKALCEFSIDSENKVYITNKAVSNKTYKWSVLKIR